MKVCDEAVDGGRTNVPPSGVTDTVGGFGVGVTVKTPVAKTLVPNLTCSVTVPVDPLDPASYVTVAGALLPAWGT